MTRNRRILHMPMEWILYWQFVGFIILCVITCNVLLYLYYCIFLPIHIYNYM
jgi:hypothetical protein